MPALSPAPLSRSTVVIRNVYENTQAFLQGHTDRVSCLSVSADGKRLASGQDIEMGFKVSTPLCWLLSPMALVPSGGFPVPLHISCSSIMLWCVDESSLLLVAAVACP